MDPTGGENKKAWPPSKLADVWAPWPGAAISHTNGPPPWLAGPACPIPSLAKCLCLLLSRASTLLPFHVRSSIPLSRIPIPPQSRPIIPACPVVTSFPFPFGICPRIRSVQVIQRFHNLWPLPAATANALAALE